MLPFGNNKKRIVRLGNATVDVRGDTLLYKPQVKKKDRSASPPRVVLACNGRERENVLEFNGTAATSFLALFSPSWSLGALLRYLISHRASCLRLFTIEISGIPVQRGPWHPPLIFEEAPQSWVLPDVARAFSFYVHPRALFSTNRHFSVMQSRGASYCAPGALDGQLLSP